MIPNLAIIHLDNPHWRPFWRHTRLWIPLFLLYIPLLLLSPLILLVVVIVSCMGRVNPFRAIATFWSIWCALRGTDVRVAADNNHIAVRIL